MHLEPLFSDFPFDELGGPWADFAPEVRRPMERGSLPISERVQGSCFWLSTPVNPDPQWVDQVGDAFRKVVENAGRVAEVAGDA